MIATCLGFAAYGVLDGFRSFGPGRSPGQLAFSNINGLFLILTVCAAIVESIVAFSERSVVGAPPRPDLGADPPGRN
jgi:hypothetical protein